MSKLLYLQNKTSTSVANNSNAEILLTGGHGGLVTYDGTGGVMEKRGAPIDRAFLLLNNGRILGDAALAIDYGCINFCTGKLDGSVKISESETEDTRMRYKFMANRSKNGLEITGGIQRLKIPPFTILVSGNVAPSIMECRMGNKSDTVPTLPYAAYHSNVVVNQQILDWFELPSATVLAGASGWDKPTPPTVDDKKSLGEYGVPFETQQHIGFTRIFLKI